jgi:hypothetical protein
MNIFITLLIGAFSVATVLCIWFNSNAPVHVTKLLKKLGFLKSVKNWPQGLDYEHWMRHEWETWLALEAKPFWAELLNCPTCLSVHISVYMSVFLALLTGDISVIVFGALCWPSAANLILKQIKN